MEFRLTTLFSLLLCTAVLAAENTWFKNPHKSVQPGEAAFSARARSGPLKPEYEIVSLKARDALKKGQQINGYIFGLGRPEKESTRIVEMLSKLSLMIDGKMIEVPQIGLRDLARLKVPESLTVFRADKFIVIAIYGPDGSEAYEVQFVSDGTQFLYRLVRHGSYGEAFLSKYPDPLRLDFDDGGRRSTK